MMSLFSFLGWAMDKSTVGFEKNPRYDEMKKNMQSIMGGFGWILLSLLLTFTIIFFVWFKGVHPIPGRFYLLRVASVDASAPPSRPIELQATMTPRMSTERVRSWVSRSLMDVYTFNFVNVDQVLKDTKSVFRDDTYNAFMSEMTKKKGLVSGVKDNSLEMTMTPITDVRVVFFGRAGDIRVWKMEFKGLLSFTGATKEKEPVRTVHFAVLVEEVPTTENQSGLSIAQIKVTNVSAD